jgi:hypothetical protein
MNINKMIDRIEQANLKRSEWIEIKRMNTGLSKDEKFYEKFLFDNYSLKNWHKLYCLYTVIDEYLRIK